MVIWRRGRAREQAEARDVVKWRCGDLAIWLQSRARKQASGATLAL